MRIFIAMAACAALAACATYSGPVASNGVVFGGPPLISGKSPPNPFAMNSEPQPQNSLPRGFQGLGQSGPNQVFPNAAAVTVPTPF